MTFGGFPVTCDAIGGAVSRDGEPAASDPAGTLAFARISRRRDVNSEIVRVATVATGRALRPVASVLDTITTLSM